MFHSENNCWNSFFHYKFFLKLNLNLFILILKTVIGIFLIILISPKKFEFEN